MLVVTHEMQFARAICNRVFYMDQGGIYEDGTPGQIFDAPQKDRTRQFIRQLKVLEFNIDCQDYDFIGAGTRIDRFCLNNLIPSGIKYRIRLAFEELLQQMLWGVLAKEPCHVLIEYAESEERAVVTVRYAGERFNPAEGGNDLSYRLLKASVEDLAYEYDQDRGKPSIVRVRIREP